MSSLLVVALAGIGGVLIASRRLILTAGAMIALALVLSAAIALPWVEHWNVGVLTQQQYWVDHRLRLPRRLCPQQAIGK